MIKTAKRVLLLIMAVISALAMTGCFDKSSGKTDDESTYPRIVVGSDLFEPYVYRDSEGKPAGIDVDIAKEAFKRMGYQPKFKFIVWENKKDYLDKKEIDCLWGCFSMNDRENEYQWAGAYMYSRQMVCVRNGSQINSISDLSGKKIAVQETGKAEEYFLNSDDKEVPDVKTVYAFSSMDEVCAALRKNYVDAIAGHESALTALVNTAPEEYRIIDESIFISKLGVAFSNNYDTEFVKKLNETLLEMKNDGTLSEIIKKYDLDPKQVLEE